MQLVLNKNGIKLSIQDGLFKVMKDDQIQKVPVDKLDSIIMHKATSLTSDVVFTALENEIEIVFMNKIGQPRGRIWSYKFGSISTIRQNQIYFARSKIGAEWVIDKIKTKIRNQGTIFLSLGQPDDSTKNMLDVAYGKLHSILEKIDSLEFNSISDVSAKLRGYEGSASRIYFECISNHLPPEYRFEKRSQHPAFDMFNAMLNYAYGMLYIKVESALIQAGIDPYIGVMHRDEYNRPVFIYDFIESYRIWADYVVIDLFMQQLVFKEFFEIENGVFYLAEQGKRILIQSINDYFEEVIETKGKARSRNKHILFDAQKLASKIKNMKI